MRCLRTFKIKIVEWFISLTQMKMPLHFTINEIIILYLKNNRLYMLKCVLNNCYIVTIESQHSKHYLRRLCGHLCKTKNNEMIDFMLNHKIELYRAIMNEIIKISNDKN
jgi:hypothetical protein